MELSIGLNNNLFEFLRSVPNIDDPQGRRALIYGASLNKELRGQITYGGPTNEFCQLLISALLMYGELEDGRDALEAVLEKAKSSIGHDKKKDCDALIQELREFKQSYKDKSVLSANEEDSLKTCPCHLGDLIRINPNCACLIHRDELLQEIKEYLIQKPDPKPYHIVLYGEPMVGKTKILDRLSETLGDEYISLIVTGQGLDTSDNLDAFVFDLADQLTNKLKEWAAIHDIPITLENPKWSDFMEANARRAFDIHWNKLRQHSGNRHFIFMFDEIERLLDDPQKTDQQIFIFLNKFVCPANGYFILAGSENIRFSNNKHFHNLIGSGHPVRVRYYNEKTVLTVLSGIRQFFSYEENTLEFCAALCDGHPRLLQAVFEAIVTQINSSPGKQRLEINDIEPIIDNVIDQSSDFLWAMGYRLFRDELSVAWLISQKVKVYNPIIEEYSLQELSVLKEKYLNTSEVNINKGLARLRDREWIEWKDEHQGLFRFKLVIFLLWLRRNYISINPDNMKLEY
ncbi:MAG: ATP-binding protein [Desulfobacteraceae bacterium]|nr:ATP-binding protein [Desulfobacteraceae bacterium]